MNNWTISEILTWPALTLGETGFRNGGHKTLLVTLDILHSGARGFEARTLCYFLLSGMCSRYHLMGGGGLQNCIEFHLFKPWTVFVFFKYTH